MKVYGWMYGRTSVVVCPRLRTDIEAAKQDAEEHYTNRDRSRHPDSLPQRLEWREQTSPRGFGFGNRFWSLFAERRANSKRLGFTGDMFATGYILNEMETEDDAADPAVGVLRLRQGSGPGDTGPAAPDDAGV